MPEQTLTSLTLLIETSLLTPVIMTMMSKELQIMQHSDFIKEERVDTSDDEEMEDEDIDVGSNDGYR